ncbi:MAG: symmetrical bis(5'-nucleosyl)-tetraphosphatase, partial [Xanthomonadales bacterium]|nr:symmetrical bis(5'-nucleosyl)-tetraphosphatase [Xanthomonadales bacterium]
MSTYLIGDIQGCYDSLQQLLQKLNFDPGDDKLWLCGDLVNRGGQSLQVLRLLKSLSQSVSITLGNHDLHLLASYERYPHGDSGNHEFDEVFAADECESLMEWLRGHPLAIWSGQHQLLRVHAGVIPQWDWQTAVAAGQEVSAMIQSDQRSRFFKRMYGNKPTRWREERTGWKRLRLITNILTRLRFCDELGRGAYKVSGPPGSQPQRYKPWYKHKHRLTRDVSIAFGHWAALGVRVK